MAKFTRRPEQCGLEKRNIPHTAVLLQYAPDPPGILHRSTNGTGLAAHSMEEAVYENGSIGQHLLRLARPYWLHLSAIFLLRCIAAPLSLLLAVPLKIVVDRDRKRVV